MWDILEYLEFNDLRIDEYELYLVGSCIVEDTHYNRTGADGFTGTRRTCDDNMGHFCDITKDYIACDILADSKCQLAL